MSELNGFNQQLPIIGRVVDKNKERRTFTVKTRSGDHFEVRVRDSTWFDSVQNLDRLDRRRQPLNDPDASDDPFDTAIPPGTLIAVEGVYHTHEGHRRYDALTVHNLISHVGYYHFEHTHWWVTQIDRLAGKWLDDLFGDTRTYQLDDFAGLYRTTLNIQGMGVDDKTQEMATLARLIYGLSSAFLLTGDERYYLAAKAGVEYQREAFRSISTDGRFCLWLHARKQDRNGGYGVLPSAFADDAGTIPLYEQIYALAGLAQYYRITNDWEVLYDIRRTVATFEAMFADRREGGRHDGFFSHIDPVTYNWDSPELGNNRARKNWNSIGDHLPAYLINLLLALNVPELTAEDHAEGHVAELREFRSQCLEILEVTSHLIREKFPQEGSAYVCERFDRDWNPDYSWGWQQNRGIVGHNLKIAWNLTRVANYYASIGNREEADKFVALARRLGNDMGRLGIDQIRSGVFDAMERQPNDPNIPIEFPWLNTKDFWQQEQGILAYLIMFGYLQSQDPAQDEVQDFLSQSRELSAFWNLYFLDHGRSGVFFRVSDNGTPVIESTYGDKGGHSISGYHVFELAYLAHIYQRAYLPRKLLQHTVFCLHFRPSKDSHLKSINVMPDFLGPDAVEIDGVVVDGVDRPVEDPRNFHIPLQESDYGCSIIVRFRQTQTAHEQTRDSAVDDDRLDVFERANVEPE